MLVSVFLIRLHLGQVVLPVPCVHKFIIDDDLEVNLMIVEETTLFKLYFSAALLVLQEESTRKN